ncbi:MAG: phytanoyl-CoA dioxygenase family protein, partial [Planctomycetes bacterium]|nr:phytanoyl-CoA dioxygenase family protein [Planctomycetota bacterium]
FFSQAGELWRRNPLLQLLRETLGDGFGLVRGLYFDKPPERSWSLPWHKDLTIAVQRNDLASTHFTNPTQKAGVAHVEASRAVLESMLTLRIHLDAVTDENGPLVVIPGSHQNGKKSVESDRGMRKILVAAGDVLAIRPLLSHCSGNSQPGTTRHRRILHLEFAANRELPEGYRWHTFQSPDEKIG